MSAAGFRNRQPAGQGNGSRHGDVERRAIFSRGRLPARPRRFARNTVTVDDVPSANCGATSSMKSGRPCTTAMPPSGASALREQRVVDLPARPDPLAGRFLPLRGLVVQAPESMNQRHRRIGLQRRDDGIGKEELRLGESSVPDGGHPLGRHAGPVVFLVQITRRDRAALGDLDLVARPPLPATGVTTSLNIAGGVAGFDGLEFALAAASVSSVTFTVSGLTETSMSASWIARLSGLS